MSAKSPNKIDENWLIPIILTGMNFSAFLAIYLFYEYAKDYTVLEDYYLMEAQQLRQHRIKHGLFGVVMLAVFIAQLLSLKFKNRYFYVAVILLTAILLYYAFNAILL